MGMALILYRNHSELGVHNARHDTVRRLPGNPVTGKAGDIDDIDIEYELAQMV